MCKECSKLREKIMLLKVQLKKAKELAGQIKEL